MSMNYGGPGQPTKEEYHAARRAKLAAMECRIRGPVKDTVKCGPCSGNVQLKVFSCPIHGSCTIAKKLGLMQVCTECPDRVS